ncbi:MAG TPA: DUF3558 family protein [Candidatus Lumbricidophila sp.]|nr:DUF3558 family protein [Candidatus Lumbricidophila sp.]
MGSARRQAQLRRGWLAASAAVTVSLLLAGCNAFDPIGGIVTKSPTPTATASPSSTPTPTASATPSPEASKPYLVPCTTLLSAQQVYDYNPNFGQTDGYSAKSAGARAASAEHGTVCGWTNQTSGSTFEVAVATPNAAALATLRAEAKASGAPAAIAGNEAYYLPGAVGELRLFSASGRLVVIASDDFTSAQDAEELAATVLGNLE